MEFISKIFKKEVPDLEGRLVVLDKDINSDPVYSRRFGIVNLRIPNAPIQYFTDDVKQEEYDKGFSMMQDLVNTFVIDEMKNATTEGNKAVIAKLTGEFNILTIHNHLPELVNILTNEFSYIGVRIQELNCLVHLTIDPKVIQSIKARYVMQIYGNQLLSGNSDTDNLYMFVTTVPWFYLLVAFARTRYMK